jgi:large subunit ribosomal protein L9
MRLVLKRDVENLGKPGEVVDVADGYANNFLMPRGLAIKATKGAVADAEALRRSQAAREAQNKAEAEELKAALESAPLTIAANAAHEGHLYGSVGVRPIAEAAASQLKVSLERNRIGLDRPIRETGSYEVEADLGSGVSATMTVEVTPTT